MESKKLTEAQRMIIENWIRQEAGLPVDMIPLLHAAEVLAKTLYERDSMEYCDERKGYYPAIWECSYLDQQEEYINRAIEELKK